MKQFLVADTQLYKRLCPSVRPSVGPSVRKHESKSGKLRISAPAHPSTTDGCVSGLVYDAKVKPKVNPEQPKLGVCSGLLGVFLKNVIRNTVKSGEDKAVVHCSI